MKKKLRKKKKKHAPQFSFTERVRIETYISEGKSEREIARLLRRESSSVRYEIREHSVRRHYGAEKAQLKAYQRRWRAKTQVLKVAINATLKWRMGDARTAAMIDPIAPFVMRANGANAHRTTGTSTSLRGARSNQGNPSRTPCGA